MKSVALWRAGGAVLVCLSLAACAPKSYVVKSPVPSQVRYAAAPAQAERIALQDNRAAAERAFLTGTLASTLMVESAPLDPAAFLAKNLQAELNARGIPAQVGAGEASAFPRIDLKTFRIQNHRQNAYSPYVTFTYLSADVETAAGKQRVGVFVKRGKVPVWSFDEIIEPTLNQPLSLAVKELAAKVANQLYGARADDAAVAALTAKIAQRSDDSYLDVYALGFANNPKAIDTLVGLTRDEDEYVRIAAISSLGNLRAQGQFDLLKSIYSDAKIWQDRAMAIKAIGDLDTPQSKAFLTEQMAHWKSQPAGKEPSWTMQVIALYL
ncbi:HEAT repeat domain-containing protein [Lysobacter sp. K5869]|uniref:HEAT repeat domain-containing protein n=1 Tax=Lysobacter sp. K5869 TaxID=2820808 RepID=UPI001C060FE8|nr:HEAT repeat domain-containing protein [Lysobacter sp. K5869]QWP77420.1 HEAT repeat domain-containing protein [Lysobacter sp. K5869]